ncbi:MAG: iron-containing alcohol dehydrogenase [Deltaproteobacteria bacterium]|nr:iron-containing alcohol dehydrogenase [Deltaproteobacteria bacterium]
MIRRFDFFTANRIVFGRQAIAELGALSQSLGDRPLLVLGKSALRNSACYSQINQACAWTTTVHCSGEPTVDQVDVLSETARAARCDHIVAIGGGSVLDCGKAISAMLTNDGSVRDYLEGVGSGRQLVHRPLPMLAAPTTAGTGSEVTKNAVISGPGFKKSIRHPQMIPAIALLDPTLTLSLPKAITAACGMDALTQLIESYLSSQASPLTDALALSGIEAMRWLPRAIEDGDDLEAREQLMFASLLGGICLANAGLGAVHGFASPIGAFFPIAHGVACAALLDACLAANLDAALANGATAIVERLQRIGQALGLERQPTAQASAERMIETLASWREAFAIPGLAELGVTASDFARIIANARGSSMKTNPLTLSDAQLEAILSRAS